MTDLEQKRIKAICKVAHSGKDGHESGTSQGYSIGECKDFKPPERSDKE